VTKASEIVDRAAIQLYDEGNESWTAPELLDALNEALGALFELRPEQFRVSEVRELVAGTRQTLPAGERFVQVVRAIAADGSPGRATTPFDPAALNAVAPDWHQGAAGAVRQFAPGLLQEEFWVRPPAAAGDKAEVESQRPPQALGFSDALPVSGEFHQALLDYVLYRAYGKDIEAAGQDGRAVAHFTAFREGAGGRATGSDG